MNKCRAVRVIERCTRSEAGSAGSAGSRPCSAMNWSSSGSCGMSRGGNGAFQKPWPGISAQPMREAGFLSSSRVTRSLNSGDAPECGNDTF